KVQLARWDKPSGALLILWPFGAGCIWNDIIDRNLDKHVERTKHRPMADGRISVPRALVFLFFHLLFLVVGLTKCGNPELTGLGLMTIFPLAGGYPFIKRISDCPQAWLGVAFNTGTLISWAWLTGTISSSAKALAVAAWFWTMWYDTIYAHQDKRDDVKIGIGSTAVLFKSTTKSKLLLLFHAVMFTLFLALSGSLNGVQPASSPYYLISVAGSGIFLATQLWYLDLDSPASCWTAVRPIRLSSSFPLSHVALVRLERIWCWANSYNWDGCRSCDGGSHLSVIKIRTK
ncbi:UbiA prenyltransferase, partial [Mycena olivaceomarginata]